MIIDILGQTADVSLKSARPSLNHVLFVIKRGPLGICSVELSIWSSFSFRQPFARVVGKWIWITPGYIHRLVMDGTIS